MREELGTRLDPVTYRDIFPLSLQKYSSGWTWYLKPYSRYKTSRLLHFALWLGSVALSSATPRGLWNITGWEFYFCQPGVSHVILWAAKVPSPPLPFLDDGSILSATRSFWKSVVGSLYFHSAGVAVGQVGNNLLQGDFLESCTLGVPFSLHVWTCIHI